MQLGRRIRELRERASLSQPQLAAELRVSHQHISQLENDKVLPSLELLVKMSKAFGVTTDFILTGQEHAEPDLLGAIRASTQLTPERKRNLIALVKDLLR